MPFPTLDDNAKTIIHKIAQEIAREYDLDYVGTEHVLLAILRHNQGVGARVLKRLDIDEARCRKALEEMMKRDMEDTWVFGRLPGTPHYRNVVQTAIDEATQLEAKQIGDEHLLLGLLREEGSAAQRVLNNMGLTLSRAREKVLAELHS